MPPTEAECDQIGALRPQTKKRAPNVTSYLDLTTWQFYNIPSVSSWDYKRPFVRFGQKFEKMTNFSPQETALDVPGFGWSPKNDWQHYRNESGWPGGSEDEDESPPPEDERNDDDEGNGGGETDESEDSEVGE